MDVSTQLHVDTQNKAYLFQAKRHTEQEVANALKTVDELLLAFKNKTDQQIREELTEAKRYTEQQMLGVQLPCLASNSISVTDCDYPVGTIVSVAVLCSPVENQDLFLENAPAVNSSMTNIYVRVDDNEKTKQVFHWNNGNVVESSAYAALPGEWRSRGMCGSYNGNVVSCKYFLAQRVK